jgi:5-methylcytosine-specific restriction endonuclease McrA
MGFSDGVREQALTACGRHCCICHKFSGLKMELHHIVHRSEGGQDTFENCIPLCFDCHGDMRSYDH